MKNMRAGALRLAAMLIVLAGAALIVACHAGPPAPPASPPPAEHAGGAASASPAQPAGEPQPAPTSPSSAYIMRCITGPYPLAVAPADAQGVVSDEALLKYAVGGYDKCAMMFKHVVLGTNHGVSVVADFPCSDLCPRYTKRVIRYDVAVEQCAEAGGVEKTVVIPAGIGMVDSQFCVPKVLARGPVHPQP